jgi:predicted  nucleic acid-binding Zn-ribbon protein
MDHAKAAISECETRILEAMDSIEAGRAQQQAADAAERATRARVDGELAEFDARQKKLEAELAELDAARALVGPKLDAQIFSLYERIASRRHPALALVSGELCEGCRVGIPAQNYLEIIKGERLITCENCKRILLHPNMVQTAGGAPPAPESASETTV